MILFLLGHKEVQVDICGNKVNIKTINSESLCTEALLYTCQLFLDQRRELFILRVQDFWRRPKYSKDVWCLLKTFRAPDPSGWMCLLNTTLFLHLVPSCNAFLVKTRDFGESIIVNSFYMEFSFLILLWCNIFLESVSVMVAITQHVFWLGMRNLFVSISWCVIGVCAWLQAWDSRLRPNGQNFFMVAITQHVFWLGVRNWFVSISWCVISVCDCRRDTHA